MDIRENWKQGGSPDTRLTSEQMKAIAKLDWFETDCLNGWKEAWETPSKGRFSTADRVKWLLALCRDERPKKMALAVPPELAESNHPVKFHPGEFLDNVRYNWRQGCKPNTRLTPEQMEAIEQLDWFPDVLAGWRKGWEGSRRATFQDRRPSALAPSTLPK